ncbi:hypothetical protein BS50DRAFT_671310 [Corynespora cassiicola Philippines]|uniref:Uncharacterized protein n=1 Tax=Corynespora cassiicola Philippines TaxID=1448308 RepID=A0A2T2PBM2_CORCC|nr:hypothetical protein BS50DRAFT_671310 [Corynespora cassiicola Philippines]
MVSIFAVAGIYSSRITAITGNKVLIKSPPEPNGRTEGGSGKGKYLIYWPHRPQRNNAFANYARDCYTDAKYQTERCKTFVKHQLARYIDRNASYPSDSSLCKADTGNIRIDTGLLDSHWDLGINAPPPGRIRFRHVLHCAPLSFDGHVWQENLMDSESSLLFSFYDYGHRRSGAVGNQIPMMNYTFAEADNALSLIYEDGWWVHSFAKYDVWSIAATSKRLDGVGPWTPIEGLQQDDSDVTIAFMSTRNILYSDSVDDPWFAAHGKGIYLAGDQNFQTYTADEVASPLGCTTQVQVCSNTQCSRRTGLLDMLSVGARETLIFPGEMSEEQRNFTVGFTRFFTSSAVDQLFQTLGGETLLERCSLNSGLQVGLPVNQWQLEVEHWSATLLASIQGTVIDYETGPSDPLLLPYLPRPQTKQQNTAHTNFSLLGLCITFSIGALILTAETLLECVYVRLLWKGRDFHQYQRLEWCVNGTLQLQRLAHEQIGCGQWMQCDEDVPVVKDGGSLALLDLGDPKHLRLRGREEGKGEEGGSSSSSSGYSDGLEGMESELESVVGCARVSLMHLDFGISHDAGIQTGAAAAGRESVSPTSEYRVLPSSVVYGPIDDLRDT